MQRNIFILFVLLVLYNSCKHDVPEQPCKDYLVPSEGFKVYEISDLSSLSNEPDIKLETDTIFLDATFRAILPYDKYTWTIGADTTRRYGKQVHLYFSNPNGWGLIRVTMIGERKPNLLCNPLDDGVDTFTKTVYNVPINQLGYYGTYEGYDVEKPDSIYRLDIRQTDFEKDWTMGIDSIKSDCDIFPGDPNTPYFYRLVAWTRAHTFYGDCSCNNFLYGVYNKKQNIISIKRFYIEKPSNKKTTRLFIGHKI